MTAPVVDATEPRSDGGAGPPRSGRPGSAAPARAGRHPAMRALALATGGLLTVAVLALTAFVAANWLVRTTESDVRTLEGSVTRVVVRVDGRVDITAGPPDRARIARTSTFGVSRPEVRRTLEGGVLTVRLRCTGPTVICEHSVEVEVPPEATLDISAHDARLADLTGAVEINSPGGLVEMDRLSGPINARVGGGSIRGRHLTSPELRATAGAGSIDVWFSRPPSAVDVSTGAGAATVAVPRDGGAYRVDAQAGAGESRVRVTTDPASSRRIRAQAGAGDVEVRYGPS